MVSSQNPETEKNMVAGEYRGDREKGMDRNIGGGGQMNEQML